MNNYTSIKNYMFATILINVNYIFLLVNSLKWSRLSGKKTENIISLKCNMIFSKYFHGTLNYFTKLFIYFCNL